jgi:hypothetical protein
MTFDEFINIAIKKEFNFRSWINEPGFNGLYVRFGSRFIKGKLIDNVIDIANIEATHPGNGCFTNLVNTIQSKYPTFGILMENVIEPRFQNKLSKLGFEKVSDYTPPNFFLFPTK